MNNSSQKIQVVSQFDRHCSDLDRTAVGFTAYARATRNCLLLDGAVVVCATRVGLRRYDPCRDFQTKYVIEDASYRSIVSSLREEGCDYLMDSITRSRFEDLLALDQRFLPQMEHYTSGNVTLIQPIYDPYRDHPALLRQQISKFIVGYLASSRQTGVICDAAGRRILRWDPFMTKRESAVSIPLNHHEYALQQAEGFRFDVDETVAGRLAQIRSELELCKMHEDAWL